MKYAKRLELAKVMSQAAKEYRTQVSRWADDPSMVKCIRNDANDLREVGRLLRTKSAKAAYEAAQHLDTIVREAIPDVVWVALQDDEEERLGRDQDYNDDITRRHIAALESQRDSLQRQIDEAKSRLGA